MAGGSRTPLPLLLLCGLLAACCNRLVAADGDGAAGSEPVLVSLFCLARGPAGASDLKKPEIGARWRALSDRPLLVGY